MDEISQDIRGKINEGKSKTDIINYLMAVYGFEQLYAEATYYRIIDVLDKNGNFKQKKSNLGSIILYILIAIICVLAIMMLVGKIERIIDLL